MYYKIHRIYANWKTLLNNYRRLHASNHPHLICASSRRYAIKSCVKSYSTAVNLRVSNNKYGGRFADIFKRIINVFVADLRLYSYRYTQKRLRTINTAAGGRPQGRATATTLQSRYEYARKLLVDSVLKRVTNSLAANLRRASTRELFEGNAAPFFSLVGVSLASGTGILTKTDEFEGVSWEIREAVRRMQMRAMEAFDDKEDYSLDSLELGPVIAKGSNAVVYEAREKNTARDAGSNGDVYPLAVKMMFNYSAESNAYAIFKAMYREMVPIRNTLESEAFLDLGLKDVMKQLPAHPNIVAMYRAFTDYIPDLPGSWSLYPDALPNRLNPSGSGRNMSLFIVMKKYDTNLKQYLIDRKISVKDGILLLTQLLEAVTHLYHHEIAHRDLKSDNILLDITNEEECPVLVITDFGCCLADKSCGFSLPYKSADADKGGNAALMAPEVALAQPGIFSYINYSKADAWTVGTLAYELFTGENPFYGKSVRNTTYSLESLPKLHKEIPPLMMKLITGLLERNPSNRLEAELAATICHVYLWGPSSWIKNKIPSSTEILQWLLSLTTKVLYQGPSHYHVSVKRSEVEYQLITTFLQRVKLSVVSNAIRWIHR